MAQQSDDSRARSTAKVSDVQAGPARARLAVAVTELRSLARDQLFQALERLSEADDIHDASSVNVESIRHAVRCCT
jgi:hypothetical protein